MIEPHLLTLVLITIPRDCLEGPAEEFSFGLEQPEEEQIDKFLPNPFFAGNLSNNVSPQGKLMDSEEIYLLTKTSRFHFLLYFYRVIKYFRNIIKHIKISEHAEPIIRFYKKVGLFPNQAKYDALIKLYEKHRLKRIFFEAPIPCLYFLF